MSKLLVHILCSITLYFNYVIVPVQVRSSVLDSQQYEDNGGVSAAKFSLQMYFTVL